ncbi:pyrroline-5-carboxylate reductase [Leptodontidium sp. MPI-SDFR-AT-0119]|nr:pyrroline-5-carboxylate reductase [Leptodontidium sp. MPI-SDFR-AT-0119]
MGQRRNLSRVSSRKFIPRTSWPHYKFCFISGGNIGFAIIGGLLAKGSTSKQNIIVSDLFEGTRKKVEETLGVRTTTSNSETKQAANVLVLTIKPQVVKSVCEDLFTITNGRALKVVRVMLNTPTLLGEGTSGSFAGARVSEDEKKLVTLMLEGFGKVSKWVDKEELSISGPAYFFLLVEHIAERLAKQPYLSTSRILVEPPESPRQLRVNVTSPKETTKTTLNSFRESSLKEIVTKAVKAAADRGEELGKAAF